MSICCSKGSLSQQNEPPTMSLTVRTRNESNPLLGSLGPPFIATRGYHRGYTARVRRHSACRTCAGNPLLGCGQAGLSACMAATPSKCRCMSAPSTGEAPVRQAEATRWSSGCDASSQERKCASLMTYRPRGRGFPEARQHTPRGRLCTLPGLAR